MKVSISTRKMWVRVWLFALVIALALLSAACAGPIDPKVTRFEKWVLHGKLYVIDFNTFGNVVSVVRLFDDTQQPLNQSDFPEIKDLLDARQRTLSGRPGGASPGFAEKRLVSSSSLSPLTYLLSTNGFLARFDPANPASVQRVNNLVCSSTNTLGSGTRTFTITPDGSMALITTTPAVIGARTPDTTPCVVFVDLNAMLIVNVLHLPLTVGMPGGIEITPDGRTAYLTTSVAFQNPSIVYVIDVATVKILTTIPVEANGQTLDEIAMAPDGSVAYLGCNACGLDKIPVIDILTNSLSRPIPVQTSNEGGALIVHPNGSKLYSVPYFGGPVTIIDTSSYKVLGTIPAPSPTGVHPPPGQDPIFTPDGRFLMILNAPTAITVVDTTSDRVDSQIPLNGNLKAPGTFFSFFYVPDGTAQ